MLSDIDMPVTPPARRRSRWRRGLRWFAAEFLVVVSGVLVALALNALYERSQDRSREAIYLRQLSRDLLATERLMEASDSTNLRWDQSLVALLGAYRAGAEPSRDSVFRWSVDLQFDTPVPILGTVDALVTTGDLGLVRDPELRSAITSYLTTTREYTYPWVLMLESEFWDARKAFRERVDLLEAESVTGETVSPRAAPFDQLSAAVPWQLNVSELLQDVQAYALLSRMVVAKRDLVAARTDLRSSARSLREEVAEALDQ